MTRSISPRAARLSAVAAAAAAVVAVVSLGGCAATTTPVLDRNFGDASRALMAQQVLDPAAPARNAATRTIKNDGRLTREAGVRLVDSYKAPPPSNVINIGVGAGASDR